MTDLAAAIRAIKSDAQVSIINEDINQITWHDDNPTNITNEQILAKQAELQADYDAKEYQRNRKGEYPSTLCDISKARKQINYKPKVDLKDYIKNWLEINGKKFVY